MPDTETAPRYTSRQIASAVGVKLRTLRRWLAAGLFSATDFRGPATTYNARHLEEARAINRLRVDNLTFAAIRRRLHGISAAELARIAHPHQAIPREPPQASQAHSADAAITTTITAAPAADPTARAPSAATHAQQSMPPEPPRPPRAHPADAATTTTSTTAAPGADSTARAPSAATYPSARWEHIVLLPGLELRVKSDGGPLLRRVAQEIYDHYAVGGA